LSELVELIFRFISERNQVAPVEIQRKFGVNDDIINRIVNFLEKFGFTRFGKDGKSVMLSEQCRHFCDEIKDQRA